MLGVLRVCTHVVHKRLVQAQWRIAERSMMCILNERRFGGASAGTHVVVVSLRGCRTQTLVVRAEAGRSSTARVQLVRDSRFD